MSGAPPKQRSLNVADSEARPVLGPAGNNATSVTKKTPSTKKPWRSAEEADKKPLAVVSPLLSLKPPRVPSVTRQELLLRSNLTLNASCSSDASTDSLCSRATTGRIRRTGLTSRQNPILLSEPEKAAKMVKTDSVEFLQGKRRCAWVTSNTDPCYVLFHDKEWGVPVYEDRKLFELLVLSGALAELTWPSILRKRHIFREVFQDFDPVLVSNLNEKMLVSPGSRAASLLLEPKLRAIVENARQINKIIEEFGSFGSYFWSFVNFKPIMNSFRYPRQVPARTAKADMISKDMVRWGFRCVGPTVIYSLMQAAGMTNDHLLGCFRFADCVAAGDTVGAGLERSEEKRAIAD